MASALIAEFTKHLKTISYVRAGWDYELPAAQRAEEKREEKEALQRARAIWSENPSAHGDLTAAFNELSPLATMSEIEKAGA